MLARPRDVDTTDGGKSKRRRNQADLTTVDAILVGTLRMMLDDAPFVPKDDSTLGRYLAQHGTVEKARKAIIDTHNWRICNGIDTLLWTWPRHPGARETAMRHYWPARIMSTPAYDGNMVRYIRMSSVDWRGIAQLGLKDVVLRHVLYMTETTTRAMPHGESYHIVDVGHSDEDVLSGRAVPIDFRCLVTVWRDILPLLSQHYPKTSRRIIFVRIGPAMSGIATALATMSRFSPFVGDHPFDFHADSALPELLKLMPPDAIPRGLGGTSCDEIGTGGYLLAPERPCFLPWMPRPAEPRLWSLQEAQAQPASVQGLMPEGPPGPGDTSRMPVAVERLNVVPSQTPVSTPVAAPVATPVPEPLVLMVTSTPTPSSSVASGHVASGHGMDPSTQSRVVELAALCNVDRHRLRTAGNGPAERPGNPGPAGAPPGAPPGATYYELCEDAGVGLEADGAAAHSLEDDVSGWFE